MKRWPTLILLALVLSMLLSLLSGCGGNNGVTNPTPTPSPVPTSGPTPVPTIQPTPVLTSTPNPTIHSTPASTSTPVPTIPTTPTPTPVTMVVVQLIKASNSADYPVSNMTISIQKTGGPLLTGVTGSDGIARINVTETGVYQILKVDGVDASNLSQGSEGREFVKASPLNNPYPNLTFTFMTIPAANVSALGSNYTVNAPVPTILKVTVLKAGSITNSPPFNIDAGTAPFSGRVMLSNINCSDNRCSIAIQSNATNSNRIIIYFNTFGGNPQISSASFYTTGGTDLGSVSNYTQAGPLYFEAPGTDYGDWALGCNLSSINLKTRNGLGGADPSRNFPYFKNTSLIFVFNSAGAAATYQFNYHIFKFDML